MEMSDKATVGLSQLRIFARKSKRWARSLRKSRSKPFWSRKKRVIPLVSLTEKRVNLIQIPKRIRDLPT